MTLSKNLIPSDDAQVVRATGKGVLEIDLLPPKVVKNCRFLYVSYNSINNLDNIVQFRFMQSLMIEYNLIETIETLLPLAQLPKLRTIRLEGNPVCFLPLWELHLIRICPQIVYINGVDVKSILKSKESRYKIDYIDMEKNFIQIIYLADYVYKSIEIVLKHPEIEFQESNNLVELPNENEYSQEIRCRFKNAKPGQYMSDLKALILEKHQEVQNLANTCTKIPNLSIRKHRKTLSNASHASGIVPFSELVEPLSSACLFMVGIGDGVQLNPDDCQSVASRMSRASTTSTASKSSRARSVLKGVKKVNDSRKKKSGNNNSVAGDEVLDEFNNDNFDDENQNNEISLNDMNNAEKLQNENLDDENANGSYHDNKNASDIQMEEEDLDEENDNKINDNDDRKNHDANNNRNENQKFDEDDFNENDSKMSSKNKNYDPSNIKQGNKNDSDGLNGNNDQDNDYNENAVKNGQIDPDFKNNHPNQSKKNGLDQSKNKNDNDFEEEEEFYDDLHNKIAKVNKSKDLTNEQNPDKKGVSENSGKDKLDNGQKKGDKYSDNKNFDEDLIDGQNPKKKGTKYNNGNFDEEDFEEKDSINGSKPTKKGLNDQANNLIDKLNLAKKGFNAHEEEDDLDDKNQDDLEKEIDDIDSKIKLSKFKIGGKTSEEEELNDKNQDDLEKEINDIDTKIKLSKFKIGEITSEEEDPFDEEEIDKLLNEEESYGDINRLTEKYKYLLNGNEYDSEELDENKPKADQTIGNEYDYNSEELYKNKLPPKQDKNGQKSYDYNSDENDKNKNNYDEEESYNKFDKNDYEVGSDDELLPNQSYNSPNTLGSFEMEEQRAKQMEQEELERMKEEDLLNSQNDSENIISKSQEKLRTGQIPNSFNEHEDEIDIDFDDDENHDSKIGDQQRRKIRKYMNDEEQVTVPLLTSFTSNPPKVDNSQISNNEDSHSSKILAVSDDENNISLENLEDDDFNNENKNDNSNDKNAKTKNSKLIPRDENQSEEDINTVSPQSSQIKENDSPKQSTEKRVILSDVSPQFKSDNLPNSSKTNDMVNSPKSGKIVEFNPDLNYENSEENYVSDGNDFDASIGTSDNFRPKSILKSPSTKDSAKPEKSKRITFAPPTSDFATMSGVSSSVEPVLILRPTVPNYTLVDKFFSLWKRKFKGRIEKTRLVKSTRQTTKVDIEEVRYRTMSVMRDRANEQYDAIKQIAIKYELIRQIEIQRDINDKLRERYEQSQREAAARRSTKPIPQSPLFNRSSAVSQRFVDDDILNFTRQSRAAVQQSTLVSTTVPKNVTTTGRITHMDILRLQMGY